jgi:hypothetical protein
MTKVLAGIQAYPLAWPLTWKRTERPRRAPFKMTLERALQELTQELRLFKARDFIVSTNIQPRLTGLPRSAGNEIRDAGMAVYWEDSAGRPRVMACDHWNEVRGNARAISITLNALRTIERCGASQLIERAFTGFVALPANATPPSWCAELGLAPGRTYTVAEVLAAHRRRVLEVHPDKPENNGSNEQIIAVNRARDAALADLRNGG